jgi:N4-(beta-N-acetylglucosaminyl)-L-asparaginase
LLEQGADTLDAVVAGVNTVEDDPKKGGVGLGGLPNEHGVMQLDASVMLGPTHEAGAVGSLEGIRNPSSVALEVCWEPDHVMLVGPGAKQFAQMHGFEEENPLTERARKAWLRWKQELSPSDDWCEPGYEKGEHGPPGPEEERTLGTIDLSACNTKREVSGVTSTNGPAWKVPGRVDDSPIIGAGLYVRGSIGSAGATGRGEAAIIACGSRVAVEARSRGLHPTDACLAAVDRVLEMNRKPHLWRDDGTPAFQVSFDAVDVKGRAGGGSIKRGSMAIADRKGSRRVDMAHRFGRE